MTAEAIGGVTEPASPGRVAITAVIPAYRAATLVVEAVESLQAQTLPPVEIIVVDDGSEDGTAEAAERAGARVIRQPNGGPASARNTGIRAATTEWIALLDADDAARPTRFAVQAPLTTDPAVAVVFAAHHVEGKRPSPTPPPIDFAALWHRNYVPTSTVLLRRSAWESLGGFDEARELIGVEDYNFWLRLAHAGWGFRRVPEVVVDYRPTAASLTAQTVRFAAAELVNARRSAERLGLDREMLRRKEYAIYLEYGLELFHMRHRAAAREYLNAAAARGPMPLGAQLRRLASYLPFRRAG